MRLAAILAVSLVLAGCATAFKPSLSSDDDTGGVSGWATLSLAR